MAKHVQPTAQGVSSPTPGAILGEAGEQFLAKIREADRALDAYLVLLSAKRDKALRLLTGITLLSRDQAAAHLAMSVAQLDREVRKGALPYIKIDRKPRFLASDLQSYIEARRATGRPTRPRKPKAAAKP